MRLLLFTLVGACALLCSSTYGQNSRKMTSSESTSVGEGFEPRAILELGAATSWNTSGGAASFAPSLAAETTPIENWLEIEAGITPFYTHASTEWDVDLLFKKPWTLSPKAEFMLGVGPEWVYFKQAGKASSSVAGEVAADFMFWPTGKHRFGWYLEPGYDYSFAAGHQKSLGVSGGLLIGLW